jgi:hypothetical protein
VEYIIKGKGPIFLLIIYSSSRFLLSLEDVDGLTKGYHVPTTSTPSCLLPGELFPVQSWTSAWSERTPEQAMNLTLHDI